MTDTSTGPLPGTPIQLGRFLKRLDQAVTENETVRYRTLLDEFGLHQISDDMAELWGKYITWREHRGWTLTDAGQELANAA